MNLVVAARERAERLEKLRLERLRAERGEAVAPATRAVFDSGNVASTGAVGGGQKRGRPRGAVGGRGVCVGSTVRLPVAMWEELREVALRLGLSRVALIHWMLWCELRALREELNQPPHDAEQPPQSSVAACGGGMSPPSPGPFPPLSWGS